MPSILERIKNSVSGAIHDDTTRMRARREKKRQQAECQTLLKRARIEQQHVVGIDRRKDESADRYQVICTPHQERRSAAESKITDYIADGQPAPPELEAEVLECMLAINSANETLAAEIKALDLARTETQKRIRELHTQAAGAQAFANELAQPPLANPELLLTQHAALQASVWAGYRVKAASEHVKKWQSHIDALKANEGRQVLNHFGRFVQAETSAYEQSQIATYQARLDRWQFELAEATAAQGAANAECDRVHQEIVDE